MSSSWASVDAETCELIFHQALKAHDWQACEAVLKMLAVKDPDRCEMLIALLQFALKVADAEATR